REGCHAAGDSAREREWIGVRADAERAQEPPRPRTSRGEIAQRRGERLVSDVFRREPARVEVDALDDLVDLEHQLATPGGADHGAVIPGTAEDSRAAAARVPRQLEGLEEGIDEAELVHCTPRSGDSRGAPGGSIGTTSVKMLPLPCSLRSEIPPPCAST